MPPNNPNQDKDSNGSNSNEKKLSPTEIAIIEMMKKQNLQAQHQQQQLVQQQQMMAQALGHGGGDDSGDDSGPDSKPHAFWDTQPMPHGKREEHPEGPIVPDKPREELRQEPYTMPSGFEWSLVDVTDADQRLELYNLLAQNYVEDDDALFRFDYSPDFLVWALTPPNYNPDFIFGVRSSSSHKLVAFISGVPAHLKVYDQRFPVVEINFLCVHKKLRSKRLAPVLIKEVTRRVNLTGVYQAVYTAGTVLPVPVSTARYQHRSLNPRKLVNIGFSRLSTKMTMARMLKTYKLPDETQTEGLRPMVSDDVAGVHALLTRYLEKFHLKILFTPDEVAHWMLPRDGVISSYVVDANDGRGITDFISFYHLPSSVLKKNETLHAAYSYYNVATSVPWVHLMKDALILAKRHGSDVFNALNLMDNDEFLEALKFGMGDGDLHYYVYNWACPKMPPNKVGIVLL